MLIGLTDVDGSPSNTPFFNLGEVVRHQLYGYRGVVVAYDPSCFAGEKWYFGNKTQPAKNQPWYHVLVHDSGGLSTYVAQSNLREDASGEPINHPRVSMYFESFVNGAYTLKEKHPSGECGI